MGTTRMKQYIETEEEGKKRRVNMEGRIASRKNMYDGLTVARAYHPPGSQLTEAVEELPNEPYIHYTIHPLTPGGKKSLKWKNGFSD